MLSIIGCMDLLVGVRLHSLIYAATMGVPLADTVAIGDSDNDLTMIEVAGIGIAMGNGEQCAKDAADWVADAVDASGLAHAFERLGVV